VRCSHAGPSRSTTITIKGAAGPDLTADTVVIVGTFLDTLRFATATQDGMSFRLRAGAATSHSGNPNGSTIQRIHVRFGHHCESPTSAPLKGELRIFQ